MKSVYLIVVAIASLFLISTRIVAQEFWEIPEYTKGLKNPFTGNTDATAEGKLIYGQMCVLCHGTSGAGNGEAGLNLEKKPANFLTLKNMSDETDGEIFWKITMGKPPMSSYDELLTEDQRWQLVNYVRQLNMKK